MTIWVLSVDTAGIVLGDGSDRLIVYRDQGVVDDRRVVAVVCGGSQCTGHLGHQMVNGNTITVEDCRISTWARLWGKRIAVFSPGMLVVALARECAATGGRMSRVATGATALSQHCLCGARVPKTLAQRTHHCPHCGLRADRDLTSAMLAACVQPTNPDDPRTARLDYRLAYALRAGLAS